MERFRYDCEENDNHIWINFDYDSKYDIEELEIGDPLEKDWMVIGFKDLISALSQAGYDIVKKESIGKSSIPMGIITQKLKDGFNESGLDIRIKEIKTVEDMNNCDSFSAIIHTDKKLIIK